MTISQQVARAEPVKQIAARIVNECLQVQEDEQVTVSSFEHTLDYASALALEIEKAGGVSTMLLETEDFFWGYLTDVQDAQYKRRQKAYLALVEATDASIGLGGPRDPSGFKKVPGERLTKMMDGEREISEASRRRKIRSIGLPIGVVTQERAKTYGFNYEQWRNGFSSALNVDYKKISVLGQKVASRLEHASNVRVTAANGTDLRFSLARRPVHVHDGILDKADVAKGTLSETLPSGFVELAPDENTTEGKVVFDQPSALRGKLLQGLTWQFKNGRITSVDAISNLDAFTGIYEPASGDKDKLATFSVGLNPNAQLIGLFTDQTVLGTVTIGIGGNKEVGGNNDSQFGDQRTLRKPTVEVDGYRLVVEGRLEA